MPTHAEVDAVELPDHQPPEPTTLLFEWAIAATLDGVSAAAENVEGVARNYLEGDAAGQVRLGLAEAMVNVVKHGYADGASGHLQLRCVLAPETLRFTLQDGGHPIPMQKMCAADGSVFDFDPTDIYSVPEGGMGLSLIRIIFDQVDYCASPGRNELILSKRLKVGR